LTQRSSFAAPLKASNFPPLSSKRLSAYNQADHPYAISDSQSGI
jgi:hypothetical protein